MGKTNRVEGDEWETRAANWSAATNSRGTGMRKTRNTGMTEGDVNRQGS